MNNDFWAGAFVSALCLSTAAAIELHHNRSVNNYDPCYPITNSHTRIIYTIDENQKTVTCMNGYEATSAEQNGNNFTITFTHPDIKPITNVTAPNMSDVDLEYYNRYSP